MFPSSISESINNHNHHLMLAVFNISSRAFLSLSFSVVSSNLLKKTLTDAIELGLWQSFQPKDVNYKFLVFKTQQRCSGKSVGRSDYYYASFQRMWLRTRTGHESDVECDSGTSTGTGIGTGMELVLVLVNATRRRASQCPYFLRMHACVSLNYTPHFITIRTMSSHHHHKIH